MAESSGGSGGGGGGGIAADYGQTMVCAAEPAGDLLAIGFYGSGGGGHPTLRAESKALLGAVLSECSGALGASSATVRRAAERWHALGAVAFP